MPFSLVPPHDMTHLIVENKNVATRGSDADRSDPVSDNVSKDSGGDTIHHDNENNQTSLHSRASNYNENEILILDASQVSTYPFGRYKPIIWPLIRSLEGNMSYVCSHDL